MKARYSAAFIEQAMFKILTRGERTIQSIADELNVNLYTIKNWMKKKAKSPGAASEIKEKRPQDWTAAEQLLALQETHTLSGEALHAWCREHGLFAHHLTSWKAVFCAGGKDAASDTREARTLKDENVQLKRELVRKEKALAEAAALLVLQKKFRALWEGEAK